MEIEITDFFPKKKQPADVQIFGTLNVYIIDIGADLKGIPIIKKDGVWRASSPVIMLYPPIINEEGKMIKGYPVFTFIDEKKHRDFYGDVAKKGAIYVEENFLKGADKYIVEKKDEEKKDSN